MEQELLYTGKREHEFGISLGVLLAVILAGTGVVAYTSKRDEPAENDAFVAVVEVSPTPLPTPAPSSSPRASGNSPTPTPIPTATPTPTPVLTYRNGTYTATGSYSSPGGTESIAITLAIVNDTVTATSAISGSTNSSSSEYQEDFIRDYKSFVVGKKVDSLSLSHLSGSSLTPKGFNAALAKIKSQARV